MESSTGAGIIHPVTILVTKLKQIQKTLLGKKHLNFFDKIHPKRTEWKEQLGSFFVSSLSLFFTLTRLSLPNRLARTTKLPRSDRVFHIYFLVVLKESSLWLFELIKSINFYLTAVLNLCQIIMYYWVVCINFIVTDFIVSYFSNKFKLNTTYVLLTLVVPTFHLPFEIGCK